MWVPAPDVISQFLIISSSKAQSVFVKSTTLQADDIFTHLSPSRSAMAEHGRRKPQGSTPGNGIRHTSERVAPRDDSEASAGFA